MELDNTGLRNAGFTFDGEGFGFRDDNSPSRSFDGCTFDLAREEAEKFIREQLDPEKGVPEFETFCTIIKTFYEDRMKGRMPVSYFALRVLDIFWETPEFYDEVLTKSQALEISPEENYIGPKAQALSCLTKILENPSLFI